MSGCQYTGNCPKCKGKDTMICYDDWKPYDFKEHMCLKCGTFVQLIKGVLDADELEEERLRWDFNPKTNKFEDYLDHEEAGSLAERQDL